MNPHYDYTGKPIRSRQEPEKETTGSVTINFPPETKAAPTESFPSKAPWVSVIVTVIALLVAAAVWASTEHLNIKDWAAEKNYDTKKEVLELVEKQYVPKSEFSEIRVEQQHLVKDMEVVKSKLDDLHGLFVRGERPKGYGKANTREARDSDDWDTDGSFASATCSEEPVASTGSAGSIK